MAHRNIVVVTGTRAEFGLLEPVLRGLRGQRSVRLSVVVAGAHLVSGTWRDVRAAGWPIAARVAMQRRDEVGRAADVQAVAWGIAGFGRAFEKLRPDVVVVLGDRIEAFAAASAASIGGIRVAHIHGGDRAEGVADEAMRHAISKLSHLHFAATNQSRRRLIRMGEDPRHVFAAGSPAVDGLDGIEPASDGFDLIVMQHPIGASVTQERRWMAGTLAATQGYRRLILQPNLDPGRDGIVSALQAARLGRSDRLIEHLTRPAFLAHLKAARAIVGNSSAGLIEAAALGVPCVNIGPRQAGREKPGNVIDCDYGTASVRAALEKALAVDRRRIRHPYGDGRAGERIARLLAEVELEEVAVRKRNTY